MGLKEYFKSSKAEARKTPAQKETDKKIEKNVLDAAKEFARDRDNELKRSLRITRFALFFSSASAAAMAVALAVMAPLKTTEPFLLRVDKNNGLHGCDHPVQSGFRYI
ncbi:VirB8 protein [Escherichia coli]|nr:VirB8 protein [Escherichia coli]